MDQVSLNPGLLRGKTERALLWMGLLHEPFVVLYALLPFILRKDLSASLFQISVLSILRPTLPIFSFYWSANLGNRRNKLRSNLMLAWILARLPFLFVPWIQNVWYIIFCSATYELFNKSGIPALIEIVKTNIPKGTRENTLTFSFVLTFLESIGLGFCIAKVLDQTPFAWRWLFCITALLGLSSLFAQLGMSIPRSNQTPHLKLSFLQQLRQPWKQSFRLLKNRPDFAQFQYGFMMGGFGLMLIAPSLSVFYADSLGLCHSTVVMGRSILMGIGIVLSSFFWKEALKKTPTSFLTIWILIGFGLYPILLVLSPFHISWFYLAFVLYGVAQAGSHLLWNLSGALFAQTEDSSAFSMVNLLMLGLRGSVAPALGGVLCHYFGPKIPFLLGSGFCFVGVLYVLLSESRVVNQFPKMTKF